MRWSVPLWTAAPDSSRNGGPASDASYSASTHGSDGNRQMAPPPDAAARAASRDAASKIARAVLGDGTAEEVGALAGRPLSGGAASNGAAEAAAEAYVHKPYTTPPGYKAPTMGEQFRYAALKHPYYRYGYVAAVVFGLLGWAIGTEEKKHDHSHHGKHDRPGAAAGAA